MPYDKSPPARSALNAAYPKCHKEGPLMFRKLIFVCRDNLCRSPVAEAIMKNISRIKDLEIVSKGIIVLFPEPYNPKA